MMMMTQVISPVTSDDSDEFDDCSEDAVDCSSDLSDDDDDDNTPPPKEVRQISC